MKTFSTKALAGTRVVGGKSGTRRIGKVRHFVFHPTEKRCVGFLVKRPDILWMFRRKDLFVSVEGFTMEDGRVCLRDDSQGTGPQAIKNLGVDWDDCVLWVGLPLIDDEENAYGFVGDVEFSAQTGSVIALKTDAGLTSNALLGKRTIPAEKIRGFKKGIGSSLRVTGSEGAESAQEIQGAILVSKDVMELDTEGGLAEKAGKSSAIAMDKAKKATDPVKEKLGDAARKTGEIVDKSAYATGKQIGKTKGMFSAFKEEYDKARHDDK